MQPKTSYSETPFQPIDDPRKFEALTALGRAINIISTYGAHHPAVQLAVESTYRTLEPLFEDQKKIVIGAVNGILTVDQISVVAKGTLLKSLERRLARLRITGLKIARHTTPEELRQLVELLAVSDASDFSTQIGHATLTHITNETMHYEAVKSDEVVANKMEVGGGDPGVLVLDGFEDEDSGKNATPAPIQVDQIVAFLKGDIQSADAELGDQLTELASDPDRLGQMIMESVAIRQQMPELAGESLNDIIIGCLRRTYKELRKQPSFQNTEGVASLKKSLLLLEINMLEKMRNLAGEDDPELDRAIVQAMREMDENLGFELAANQYLEHRDAIEKNRKQMTDFLKVRGNEVAEEILEDADFPQADWRKIVVESKRGGGKMPLASGLETLTHVFEKLERLMRSETTDDQLIKELLGQASENLDDTLSTTQDKLVLLSKQIKKEEDTGTIGGQAMTMNRKELLISISEVAQELMQPLTAMNASLEMMIHGYVGAVSEEQNDMLTLAYNSGEHLKHLMNELITIVGFPTNKGIDKRFHTTSKQVVQMQNS